MEKSKIARLHVTPNCMAASAGRKQHTKKKKSQRAGSKEEAQFS